MSERLSPGGRSSDQQAQRPWSVPVAVADIPDTGRRVDLNADQSVCAVVAEAVGVVRLSRLEVSFELTRHGRDGLRLAGRVTATVTQSCVVTLEPVEREIDEAVDLVFMPLPEPEAEGPASSFHAIDAEEPPETLHDGVVDLGAVATEFLILGIDPYARAPGAVFAAPPATDAASHPFAALAALKKGDGSKNQ